MRYEGARETMLIDSEVAPGGVIVYYADGDEEIIHVNSYVINLFECDSLEDFMGLTGGSFKGLVCGDDIGSAEESIWSQVSGRDGLDHIYYQIRTKTGRTVSIDDYGRLVERPGERPVFYVFITEMDISSSIDWLTGLASVERFKYLVSLELSAGVANGERYTVVVFDLMGMKVYNVLHGREGGNALLRAFAEVIRRAFGSEACCRFEGDSFCVLAASDTVNERIATAFQDFAECGLPNVPPVMAGACVCKPGDDITSVLDRASFACMSDQRTWESHVTWFTNSMRSDDMLRVYVLEHLDQAISEGWIRPYYQGIVRSASGVLCGEEALARWDDPQYGVIYPDQFIPVLDEAGALFRLDLHIVDCVLADIVRHQKLGAPVVPVSVNISLRELDQVDLASEIAQRADAVGVDHTLIRVEITESLATRNPDLLKRQVRALHELGFEVWMDDFGSGYSSLNALGEFDFDLIKLDAGFIIDDRFDRAGIIIDGVIRAAKRMGLRVLAEGVEKREDANRLADVGCDMLQGFFFAHPEPFQHNGDEYPAEASGNLDRLDHLEPHDEVAYWNAVGSVSLADLASNGEGRGVSETSVAECPAGVFECRDGVWHALRLSNSLRSILTERGALQGGLSVLGTSRATLELDELFVSAVDRCEQSGAWERISGPLERGSGFQSYVRPLAACARARAYLITSTPTLLGSALGTYGDVPVGYAVLRVILNEAGDGAQDIEYVYVNDLYREWSNLGVVDYTGRRLLKVVGSAGLRWLPLCYRAAILGESSHDIYYSPEAGHWLSFNIQKSPIEGHCVFAFTIADAEQMERAELIEDRNTSERIIGIADALNDELGYEAAMKGLLEEMSKVIHPERLYIFERGPKTSSNTFEWCAPGIEPMIDTLQDLDNSEFATWDELLSHDPVVVIPDVSALRGVDDRLYDQLSRQGIDRMLAVPFYEGDKLIGYLGADNYALEEGLDTSRLLETVASFISARIVNRRLLNELERTGTHDALTGLLNRRGIDEEMRRRMDEGVHDPFVLVLLDVDDFKTINDLYGHDVGDEALRALSAEVREVFPEGSVIGRNGGDEALAAVFGEDAQHIEDILTKLMQKDLHCEVRGKRYPLTLSVGYAWCTTGTEGLKNCYTRADEALYAVKLAGKSGFRGWSPEIADTPRRSMLGFATRDLANAMPLAMMAHQTDGQLLYANEGLARMLGYEGLAFALPELGESIWEFVHPFDAVRVRAALQRMQSSNGDDLRLGFRVISRLGRPISVSYRGRLVESEGAKPVVYAYMEEKTFVDGSRS